MKTERHFFQTSQLQHLVELLHNAGYKCIGPQIRDGTIVYDEVQSIDQLPQGIKDNQKPGLYALIQHKHTKYFDWANGPQAIKPFLFSSKEILWQCKQADDGTLSFKTDNLIYQPIAILGVRACDVAALKIHDQHFTQQQFVDPYYQARREKSLIIAVNCSSPASTCFCHSTGDGPFNEQGFDIALTELEDGFLCEAQTVDGEHILNSLELYRPTDEQFLQEQGIFEKAILQQRHLPDVDFKKIIFEELNNPAWDDIAKRCLSCGNCTSVCPSCFCHSESEAADLDGKSSTHYREWDSCFSQGHSYIHGITIRAETSQRYRQWLSHKFSSWFEQYGRSGCVGCGRCITWCPVGIDVTESLAVICGENS